VRPYGSAAPLEGAQLFELALTGSPHLPGLLGNGLRVSRDLDLSRSRVAGAHWTSASTSKPSAIWLCEAQIGGRLLCAGAALDGQGYRSIHADRINVGGAVRLIQGFRSVGEVRLHGARIESSLDLNGAWIESLNGPAIDLENAIIDGSVFLIEDPSGRHPKIQGRITMASARISARLLIRNATMEAPADEQKGSIYERSTSIGTALNAPRLSVGAEVMLAGGCDVTGRIDMSVGDMSSLTVDKDCTLRAPGRTALDLSNANIRALLRLDENAAIEGSIGLVGAVIHGTLALHGKITQPESPSLVKGSAMTVDGDVYLDGLRANDGGINFRGATLGSLSARRAQLHNPGGYTIRLSQAVVKGPVRLIDGFSSTGLVAFNRSTIEGRLHFTGGSFHCPAPSPSNEQGHAIEAISATVRGSIDLGWKSVSPSVDFTDATTTFLADNPATWPERFTIAGLTYDRFENPQGAPAGPVWDQAARSAWLSRQSAFDSGPYEQAARVFRQHGYTSEAEQILIAQRRHARQVGRSSATWPRRALEAIYAIIGYGYRPARVLWLLAALLVLIAASLELPASQATLRATNGNGDVYTTTGLLTTSARLTTSGPARSNLGCPAFSGRVICGLLCCCLHAQILVVGLLRSSVPECGMKTHPIVPDLDVAGNIVACLLSRRIDCAVHALDFQCGIERLSEGVVEANPGAPYGLADPQPFQGCGELGGRIVAATIGMEYRTGGKIEVPCGHLDCCRDERRLVVIVHRPPDDLTCRAVNDRREIKPSLPCRDVGNIADHFFSGRGRAEVTSDKIGDRPGLALLGGRRPPGPRLAGHQPQLTHQAADQLQPGLHTPSGQLQGHPAVAIRAVGVLKSFRDQQFKLVPPFCRSTVRTGSPFVEPGLGYLKPGAHLSDRRSAGRFPGHGGILRLDERVLLAHRGSLAKYAAAFFRNAFSISSSRFRRSSSRNRARSEVPSTGSSPAWLSRYAATQ
jgi:hypothetical protein